MTLAAIRPTLSSSAIARRTTLILLVLAMISGIFCNVSGRNASIGDVAIHERVIATGLTLPWDMVWAPDNHIWMTERGGRLSRVDPGTGKIELVYVADDVVSNGEGGMLGIALHPNFMATPYVYIVYDYNRNGNYREKLVRFTYNARTLIKPLVLVDNIAAAFNHDGSRLVIVKDKLFMTTGDATDQSSPQDLNSLNGKILRLNLDGSIPSDNPIPGNAVWTLGHRNPQGLVFANGILYSSEHGPGNNDEVNIIEKGRNYGWPSVEGFCNTAGERRFCSANNVKEPIQAWSPTIAACGLEYYNSDLIPQWKGSLLLVALKNARMYQLKLNPDKISISKTVEYFANSYGRLRDVCVSASGKVYICTSNGSNDKLIEIAPAR